MNPTGWRTWCEPSGTWLGVNDERGLAMQGDSEAELNEAIEQTMRLLGEEDAEDALSGPRGSTP